MRLLIALVLLLAAWPAVAAPALWGALEPGPYAVGVRTLRDYDRTRPGLPADQQGRPLGQPGRPMQVTVWYPARATPGPAAPFSDYVISEATRVDLSPATPGRRQEALDAFARDLARSGATPAQIAGLLAQPTAAHPGAPQARGRFPLALYAHIEPAKSGLMAEHLASHGYVVAAIPWKGSFRYDLDVAASGVETQTLDLAWTKAALLADPQVDPARVAVIGMSFGSMAAVALQMRDPAVRAVVSLDGGVGSPTVKLLRAGPFYAPARMTAPLGHFYGPDVPGGDLAWFGEIPHAPRLIAPYPGLAHGDFVATPMLEAAMGVTPRDGPRVRGFERLCRDVRDFLDAALNGRPLPRPPGSELRDAA